MVIVVMGVSGSGKTTIGRALATRLGWPFEDGDDLHPTANVAQMRRGIPLTDADRAPWLERLGAIVEDPGATAANLVLACSALRKRYRDVLRAHGDGHVLRFVHLKGDYELIAARIRSRTDHFMPASLLQSQFDTLEEPTPDE